MYRSPSSHVQRSENIYDPRTCSLKTADKMLLTLSSSLYAEQTISSNHLTSAKPSCKSMKACMGNYMKQSVIPQGFQKSTGFDKSHVSKRDQFSKSTVKREAQEKCLAHPQCSQTTWFICGVTPVVQYVLIEKLPYLMVKWLSESFLNPIMAWSLSLSQCLCGLFMLKFTIGHPST